MTVVPPDVRGTDEHQRGILLFTHATRTLRVVHGTRGPLRTGSLARARKGSVTAQPVSSRRRVRLSPPLSGQHAMLTPDTPKRKRRHSEVSQLVPGLGTGLGKPGFGSTLYMLFIILW